MGFWQRARQTYSNRLRIMRKCPVKMRKLAVKIRKHAEKIRYPAGKNVETEDSAGKGQTNVEMHRKKQGKAQDSIGNKYKKVGNDRKYFESGIIYVETGRQNVEMGR